MLSITKRPIKSTERSARLAGKDNRATPMADLAPDREARRHAEQTQNRADRDRGWTRCPTRPADTETTQPRRARSGRQTRPEREHTRPQVAKPQSATVPVALLESRLDGRANTSELVLAALPARHSHPSTSSRSPRPPKVAQLTCGGRIMKPSGDRERRASPW